MSFKPSLYVYMVIIYYSYSDKILPGNSCSAMKERRKQLEVEVERAQIATMLRLEHRVQSGSLSFYTTPFTGFLQVVDVRSVFLPMKTDRNIIFLSIAFYSLKELEQNLWQSKCKTH